MKSLILLLALHPLSDSVYNYAKSIGIQYPEICTSQAVHESANFTSYCFRARNNCLGMKGRDGKYKVFLSWKNCIDFYKIWQVRTRHLSSYKCCLNYVSHRYAADRSYGKKLRAVIKRTTFREPDIALIGHY